MFFGESSPEDIITRVSLDGSKTEDLLGMDFVIDMSATARNIDHLFWYYRFKNFLCYRNGFASFPHPRIDVKFRNHVVPSKQNQILFRRGGYEAECVYYGIPEFYSPGRSDEHWKMFEEKYNLVEKEYFLFPHRPHPDKGVNYIPALAKTFPDKKFVIAANTPILEHQMFLNEIRVLANKDGLKNLLIVDMPLNPKHHYYKRELMRRAKAVLSPIIPPYFEGFGLATGESIACSCPVIISDSPSTRELWRDRIDVLVVEGEFGFKMAIENIDSYQLKPENRYTVENYAKGYLDLIFKKMMNS